MIRGVNENEGGLEYRVDAFNYRDEGQGWAGYKRLQMPL